MVVLFLMEGDRGGYVMERAGGYLMESEKDGVCGGGGISDGGGGGGGEDEREVWWGWGGGVAWGEKIIS